PHDRACHDRLPRQHRHRRHHPMTAVTHTPPAPDLTAAAVARFLQQHPDFFTRHAEIFASLEVPHPHQARAISLGERQIMTLRERVRELEWRLAELSHNATGNESISRTITGWCRSEEHTSE